MSLFGKLYDNTVGLVVGPRSITGQAVDAITNAVDKVGTSISNVLQNPIPIIETVALTYALGPEGYNIASGINASIIANAAVAAANGGNINDIARAAATAYAGAQAGKYAGSFAAPDLQVTDAGYTDQKLMQDIITSSSGAAATVALRGGKFSDILTAGVASGIAPAVQQELMSYGINPNTLSSNLISRSTSAAAKAILSGTSVSDAIANSVVLTGLTSAVQETGQLLKSWTDNAENYKQVVQADIDKTNNFIKESGVNDLAQKIQTDVETLQSLKDKIHPEILNSLNLISSGKYTGKDLDNLYETIDILAKGVPGQQEVISQLTDAFKTYSDDKEKYDAAKRLVDPYISRIETTQKNFQIFMDEVNKNVASLSTKLGQEVSDYAKEYAKLTGAEFGSEITNQAIKDLISSGATGLNESQIASFTKALDSGSSLQDAYTKATTPVETTTSVLPKIPDVATTKLPADIKVSSEAQDVISEFEAIKPDQLAFVGAVPSLGSAAMAETQALLARLAATPAGQAALREAASYSTALRDAIIGSSVFGAAGGLAFLQGASVIPEKPITDTTTKTTDAVNLIPTPATTASEARKIAAETDPRRVDLIVQQRVEPYKKIIGGEFYSEANVPVTTDVARVAAILDISAEAAAQIEYQNKVLFDYLTGGGEPTFKAANPDTMRSTDLIVVSRPGFDDNIVIQRNDPIEFTSTDLVTASQVDPAVPKIIEQVLIEPFVIASIDPATKKALLVNTSGKTVIADISTVTDAKTGTSVNIDTRTNTVSTPITSTKTDTTPVTSTKTDTTPVTSTDTLTKTDVKPITSTDTSTKTDTTPITSTDTSTKIDTTPITSTKVDVTPITSTDTLTKVDTPVVDKPIVDKPIVDKPIFDKPIVDKPIVDKPIADKPVVDKPVVDKPVVDKPVADKPVVDTQLPVVDIPSTTDKTKVDTPVSSQPSSDTSKKSEDPFLLTFFTKKMQSPLGIYSAREQKGPVSTTGLTAYRPAGEIESEETGKERQDVWNEASLRLKDALGL